MHAVEMPLANVHGRGRDPAFNLPQFFVDVDRMRTAYADSGGDGEPVIFVHGLAGNAAHWVHVAHHFTDRYRVLAIDLPGCGESESYVGPYNVRMYARHVMRFMDTLGIEKATLVGHSLGGMVATEMAMAHPGRLYKAVLINPAGYQRVPRVLRGLGFGLLREPIMNALLPKVYRSILDQVFAQHNRYTAQFTTMVRATYKDEDVVLISKVIAALRDDFLGRDYTPQLKHIKVPMFFLWGGKDRLVPSKRIHKVSGSLPHVHAEEIPECGHMPIIEQPHHVVHFIEKALATP